MCAMLVLFTCAYGQEPLRPDSLSDFQEVVESFMLDIAPESDEAESGDQLIRLSENPVDLNSAGWSQLQQIPGVTPLMAYRIMAARGAGEFSNLRDLLLINGIDEPLYRTMLPFIKLGSPPSASSIHVRTRLQSDLQNRRGFLQGSYPGHKQKYYLRASFERSVSPSSKMSGNITVEKDPGELAGDAFRSGYLAVSHGSFDLTAGDYVVSSGNSHVLARGAGIGRGRGRMLRRVPAIAGYQSADEQRFFRGLAVAGSVEAISFGAFYSNKPLHGTIQDDGSVRFDHSGLFRTIAERFKRNVARERVFGGYVSTDFGAFTAGITGYDARMPGRSSDRSIGLDGSWRGERWLLAGSMARENSGAGAIASTVELDPLDGWNFFVVRESFTRGFSARHAFVRAAVPASLVAAGLRVRLARKSTMNVSAYSEHFPHGKEGDGFSENESGAIMESALGIFPLWQLDLRVLTRDSPVKFDSRDSLGRARPLRAMQTVRKFRVGFAFGRSRPMGWVSRMEVVSVSPPDQTRRLGFMVSQELRYTPSSRLKILAKVTIFSIEDFDARIFSFESQVPGVLMSRVLIGEGTRSMVSVVWKPIPLMEFSASFSAEVKDGQRVVGSGLEEIRGDMHGRFTVQMDIRL